MGAKTGTKVLFKPQPEEELLKNSVLKVRSIKMKRFSR
jgi:hypothetical protein